MLDLAPADAMALKPGLVALERDVAGLIALLETTRQ
jgi:hypothetical protein